MMDIFKKCYQFDTAKKAREGGYYPYFHELTSKQDTVVHMEGKEMIMIGSNNYLGLTSHPEVIQAAVEATLKYGTGVSGSRFLNGTLNLHKDLERELAEFLNKEDCTIFSTGFQSNLGIISAVAGRNDIIFSDKENHASIYDGTRLSYAEVIRYEHSNMEDLAEKLSKAPENKGKIIITDGVFSMSGDIAKLPEIVALAKEYGARVMVDDAHGFGVMGPTGRGTAEHFGLEKEIDIIMGTFSKSLASLGGYVAAESDVVDYIRHNSRPYIFSAAIPAANTAAALAALRILKREPERVQALHDIADYMRQGLKNKGLKIRDSRTPIIPIFTYTQLRTLVACNSLFEQGVYVNPVVPPATPIGECLIRTSYTATHTKEQMDIAIEKIAAVLKNLEDFEE
ncbi:pyridoxal phosphate-dependent aminotransferase family protein [Mariniplasma sp. M4Ah]|uniref:Pyridoxal phosphate-dependent aminotransferase family protein n=2 Tax=Peloplasma aerotolerans TaxID=3044389 RepID=A0AAW6UC16_9MOLU|nr:pyridoxal phosphate-dependent aminotransferase family protein [Mariniplasma sp. M4Ah]MDI6453656.1 pyridoxal phosphate-dependent aminotransferase family protein [Mariniplasma sp. M4Ah]